MRAAKIIEWFLPLALATLCFGVALPAPAQVQQPSAPPHGAFLLPRRSQTIETRSRGTVITIGVEKDSAGGGSGFRGSDGQKRAPGGSGRGGRAAISDEERRTLLASDEMSSPRARADKRPCKMGN